MFWEPIDSAPKDARAGQRPLKGAIMPWINHPACQDEPVSVARWIKWHIADRNAATLASGA